MLDFIIISTKMSKSTVEIYPKFVVKKSKDLMIRGGEFYAIWDEANKCWSTDEDKAQDLIDAELKEYAKEYKATHVDTKFKVLYLWDADTGSIDRWHKYCKQQMIDNYRPLDERLIFSNSDMKKEDYSSKHLNYPLESGDISSYEELISVLYNEEERRKLEWGIGSIVSGDSRDIQKFFVLYGSAGTGKSTVLNIIQMLFDGYWSVFDGKALGQASNQFAMEAFKDNPLIAIQHDGDLSHIEDNTRLNSIVSHETMTVNEKFKNTYPMKFNSMLFMGTNKPVKITDSKSGLLRRLIDVSPTGETIPNRRYKELMDRIKFELGGIASHCLDVYLDDKKAYDDYVPLNMMDESNYFYNFVMENFDIFKEQEVVSLKQAWEMYKTYCDDGKVPYPMSKMIFKNELKNYFEQFLDRYRTEENSTIRNVYKGFLINKFVYDSKKPTIKKDGLRFECEESLLDIELAKCKAQYASSAETPKMKWSDVETKLTDIDTKRLHYVKVPTNHIVIDFDLKTKDGEKSFKKNLEEANKWPPTYAELSKSGQGIHLHYIYDGDVSKLSSVYDEDIEVKVFTGGSSLRRRLTKCNDIPIRTINSGLPLKGDKKMVDFNAVKSEKSLRNLVLRNLNKEIHPGTKPSIDFITKILDDAYDSGLKYDITDMRPKILAFAANSTHQADYCIKAVNNMKFHSDEPSNTKQDEEDPRLIFYDVEVFPNLFLVNWKIEGEDHKVVRMINPTPGEIEELIKHRLVGFNCRRYDNHIMYARLIGYSNEQLYDLSQKIVNGSTNCFFGEAYNLSYTDVYDFSSKKQSLKKFEIELGIHHQELGLPWDQPVAEELWEKVAAYCDNDVIATEATFNARKQDFVARQVLADLSGLTVNDTTRMHSTKIIFGDEKHPDLVYTDLSEMFPGYKYEAGHSIYRGEDPGEGGYVYAEPGMYGNVALLDVASMHPTSIIQLNLFGSYTDRFKEILDARIAIKHKDFDSAKKMLNGALEKYLISEDQAADLAQALKIVINSVYGYTTATFDNPFKDPRNVDNIVAKRGALFMIDLKHAVQEKGFKVAHIKTDSIKIPDATPEIIEFCMEFGKKYGYNFEHEATYDRMCLVNDAVYIAKYKDDKQCQDMYGYIPGDCKKHPNEWTATGTQFQVPYVFKFLFSKEPIVFQDKCETKTVSSNLYLDMNESNPEEHSYHFVGKAGLFCPIKKGCGGGELLREKDGKYYAATGTKGYRWLESEMVESLGKEADIDTSYYNKLVDEAVNTIEEFGDFKWFVSDEPYIPKPPLGVFMNIPEDAPEPGIPWD